MCPSAGASITVTSLLPSEACLDYPWTRKGKYVVDIETCKPLPPPPAVAAREVALTCIQSVAPELQPKCWKWHRFTLTAISLHAACRAGRTRGRLEEISSAAAAAEFKNETRSPPRVVSRPPSAVKGSSGNGTIFGFQDGQMVVP